MGFRGDDFNFAFVRFCRSEEPITSVNMDITTGHVILAYIEEHLNDKNRLTKEWADLCDYEADSIKTEAASLPQNLTKNRYSNILACKLNGD